MSVSHHSRRAARRVLGLTLLACLAVGSAAFFLSHTHAVPSASAASIPADSTENGLLTAAQAQAMLEDPRMVLVNHTNKMPDDYTFTTKACGSKTAVNKELQTEAADAFLQMQAAAAKDGVTIWMQSGYRSVDYQAGLYERKTQYFRNKGYGEAEAKEKAAAIVNPPGYSEHNCGLAADLNCPAYTSLDTGFEKTRRTPKPSPRSPMSRGTGGMWGRKMPSSSTRAACALKMPSPPCRSWQRASPSPVKKM